MGRTQSIRFLKQFLLPALVLLLLLLYTYARFFALPYLGFQYGTNGEILEVFTAEASRELEVNDQLLEVNGLQIEEYYGDLSLSLFGDLNPGDSLVMRLENELGEKQVELAVAGFNFPEFFSRLLNTWWLSYLFWISGTIIFFHLRPQGTRWRLLVLFFYLTAVWLIAGSLSRTAIYYSPFVFRIAIWLCLPVYLHLHWNFPRPFAQLPRPAWAVLYSIGIGFAVLQALNLIPTNLYSYALLVAVLGSLLMLLVRLLISPGERREVAFILIAFAIALAPSVILGLAVSDESLRFLSTGSLFSLLACPGAYLYIVYRRQLGGLELRANRLISVYLFLVLLFTGALILLAVFSPLLQNPQQIAIAILVTGLLVTLFNIFAFERFQRFVERKLLNIPTPPEGLQQRFANLISTSFTRQHLGQTLMKQVLPALLIRQSALLHFEARTPDRQLIYAEGISPEQLPDATAQQELLTYGPNADAPNWVQQAIPVRAGNTAVGLWLLGRKDPDDYYSYAEANLLRSLADQMAIALVNIEQADMLRVLYRRDIDQEEERRAYLARELHDSVLGGIDRMALLAKEGELDALNQHYQALSDDVRRLIYRLRPAMLDFGLYRALVELADDLTSRLGDQVQVALMLPENQAMFDGHVAEHAYRIVQQAIDNAIAHGKPQAINISGRLDVEAIDLLIEDDGAGFDVLGTSLPELLAAKHYGLASMNERAALIGAYLYIDSKVGEGTQVRLVWPNP